MPTESRLARIYIGPMSKNIVDAVIAYNNLGGNQVGLIASRRQVDNNGGYVNGWTTQKFVQYVRSHSPKTLVCRDHGGINQGKSPDYGSVSLVSDSVYMDIVHIDPFKGCNFSESIDYTADMIKRCCRYSDTVMFEVGTEEAIFNMSDTQLSFFLESVQKKIPLFFNRIIYAVIQSGTKLRAGANVGDYDYERLRNMLLVCQKFGIKSKEHNGDYLPVARLKEKFSAGLSAINIAPELANIESKIILDNIDEDKKIAWFHLCIADGQWKKWFAKGFNPDQNRDNLLWLCGHYVFSSEKFKDIISLDYVAEKVRLKIFDFINSRMP